MCGRNCVVPVEVQANQCKQDAPCEAPYCDFDTSSLQECLQSVPDLKQVVHLKVSSNIDMAQVRQQEDFNKRQHKKDSFHIGDSVLLWNNKCADRKGGKSVDLWYGPYDIYKEVGKGLYQLKDSKTSQVLKKKANACNLKHYMARLDDVEGNEDVLVIAVQEKSECLFIPTDGTCRKSIANKLGLPPLIVHEPDLKISGFVTKMVNKFWYDFQLV